MDDTGLSRRDRLRRGWRLARGSWSLLRRDRRLLVLPMVPVLAGLGAVALTGLIVGPPWQTGGPNRLAYFLAALVCAYPFALLSAFTGVVFMTMAGELIAGRTPSFRAGFAAAWERRAAIAWWALLAAGVGALLQSLEQVRGGALAARIASWALGVVWSLVTFLAIPVLTLERQGVKGTVRRSAALFKERWGEQVGGRTLLGGVFVLLSLPAALLYGIGGGVLSASPGSGAGVGIVIAAVALTVLVGTIYSGLEWMLSLVLYRLAVGQAPPGAFATEDLEQPFRAKRRRRSR